MRVLQVIQDDEIRSKALALARARHLPVRQEGPWVEFYTVNDPDPDPVLRVLKAGVLPVPALGPATARKRIPMLGPPQKPVSPE